MKQTHYIGGEFASNDLDAFVNEHRYNELSPKFLNGKELNFFETGTDSLAAIIIENCLENVDLNFWIPDNYCFETIERLKIKLSIKNINLNILKYYHLSDITIQNYDCVLLYHNNLYIDFEKYDFGGDCFTIEDFVHAPLDIKHFKADYAFNSLRKFCHLELSMAYMNKCYDNESNDLYSDYFNFKNKAKNLKSIFLECGDVNIENEYLNLFKLANEKLFVPEIVFAQQKEIETLGKVNFSLIRKRREDNFLVLKNELSFISDVKICNGLYMLFIIECKNRDELKKWLASKGIFTAIHWLDSNSIQVKNKLSIHIDHRYSNDDIYRISREIHKFYEYNNRNY